MRAIKLFAVAVLALGALVAAPQAAAQGFYVGGSVGQSDFNDGNVVPDLITSGTVDGKDTGFKIFGGYQFNPYFGLELAIVDLGEASYSGTFGGVPVVGGTVDAWGFNFSAVGTLPLGAGFALFGKVGLFVYEAEANDVTGGLPFTGTSDDTNVSFGVGASYDFTRNFRIQVEWERFEAVDTIDLLSIGVVYKF
jgi:OOP family OmpA-OmpF porin